jgi:hypothetical protein
MADDDKTQVEIAYWKARTELALAQLELTKAKIDKIKLQRCKGGQLTQIGDGQAEFYDRLALFTDLHPYEKDTPPADKVISDLHSRLLVREVTGERDAETDAWTDQNLGPTATTTSAVAPAAGGGNHRRSRRGPESSPSPESRLLKDANALTEEAQKLSQ